MNMLLNLYKMKGWEKRKYVWFTNWMYGEIVIHGTNYYSVKKQANKLEIMLHQQFAFSHVLLFSYFCTCHISFQTFLFPFSFFVIFCLLSSFAFVFINHRIHVCCHHCSHNFLHHKFKHQPSIFTSRIQAPASHHHCSHNKHYQLIILIS